MKLRLRQPWASSLTVIYCLLFLSASLIAQEETGNLYGLVTDTSGELLPGASIELTGRVLELYGAPPHAVEREKGALRREAYGLLRGHGEHGHPTLGSLCQFCQFFLRCL